MRPLVRLLICTAVSLSLICWSGCNATNSNSGIQDTPMSIQVAGSFPVGVVGQTYPAQKTAVLTVTGGTAPYTWSIATGSFPKGLTLNSSTGEVSGTPTEAGQQWGFTVQVEDAKTQTVTQGISITIDTPMTLSTTPPPASIAGANYSFSLAISGGTWPFTEKVLSGVLPPGLSLNGSSGAIAGVPTTPGTYSFTIQITDSENVSVTTGPLAITIAQQALLSISTASFPAGTAGVPYGPETLNATGGVPPYIWTMTSGSAPGLSIFEVGLAGTPAVAGTDQFTLTVTDSAAKPNSANQGYSLTVNPGGGTYACGTASGNESAMSGPWAFLMNGFDDSGSPFAIAGSFTANGSGAITAGEEDYNDPSVGPANLTLETGPTGSTYSIDSNGRGCLNFVTSAGSYSYAFALSSTNPSKGRIIELDDIDNTSNTARVTGILRQQTPTDFALSSLHLNYAFGISGWNSNLAPIAMAGSFTLDNSTGNISVGFEDSDTGSTTVGSTSSHSGVTGTIGTTFDSDGRGSMTYSPTVTLNFTIYIVNQNEFFLIGADALSPTAPFTSGEVLVTSSSFTNASLSGGYILETTGYSSNLLGADVMIGQLSFNDSTNAITGTLFEDLKGTVSNPTVAGTAQYGINTTSGRVTLSGAGPAPTVYLTTPTDGIAGFIVGTDPSASFGLLEAQSGSPYSSASLAGNYILGTAQLGDGTTAIDQLGYISFASGAVGTGIIDQSQIGANGLLINQPFDLTFSTINSDGTGNAGANTAAVTNGTTVYFINEATGVDPSILVIEQ